MLLSHAHGYSGPVHDEVSVGGREVSAGSGRNFVTSSQIHAIANSPPLIGNTPSAFQLDPYAFRPPSVTETRRQRAATPDESFGRQSRGRSLDGRPSTVGGGQRTRSSLSQQQTSGVRMHGGGLVEAGKLPRPRQEGPDLRFQVNPRLAGGRAAYSGEYTQQGGSPDGSHRVAESFHGSPVRLAPVPDVTDSRRQESRIFATEQDTVIRLESPEPPELGTLPRMYQVQERIKFYMCEVVKDPSGRSLRKLYAEKLGAAGRDVRDKESLQFIEMAKLLAMNELGQMYHHPGGHTGEVPLPPYPTAGNVSSLMHRDLEKKMIKQRENLDAIAAAEIAGNLEAAEAMRARLEEEANAQQDKTGGGGGSSKDLAAAAAHGRGAEPEPEPEQQAAKALGNMFSRGNLLKALTDQGAKNTTEVVHNFATIQALAGSLLIAIQQLTAFGGELDALTVWAKKEEASQRAGLDDKAKAERTALAELLGAVKAAASGLLTPVRAFCESNLRRAVRAGMRESDDAQAGSERVVAMWGFLEPVGTKAALADEAIAELAARAGLPCQNGVELAQSAMASLAELDQLWNDSLEIELPEKQQNPWVDGLEALLQAEMRTSKDHEKILLARAESELQKERDEVKRLQGKLADLEYENRTAKADRQAVAVETAARDARVRDWMGAVVVDSVGALGGELITARERAWTSEDAVEGHKWSPKKLRAVIDDLRKFVAPAPPEAAAAAAVPAGSDEGREETAPNDDDAEEMAAPLPALDTWVASLGDTIQVLFDASRKATKDFVSQYQRMREDVVRYEIMKLDVKLEAMKSRDAFAKTSDHGAKARKVATDEHMRLQRELEALRCDRGVTKGDKSFDSAWNHRGPPLPKSPPPAADSTGGSPRGSSPRGSSPRGSSPRGSPAAVETGAGAGTSSAEEAKAKVKFRSPR